MNEPSEETISMANERAALIGKRFTPQGTLDWEEARIRFLTDEIAKRMDPPISLDAFCEFMRIAAEAEKFIAKMEVKYGPLKRDTDDSDKSKKPE